MKRIIALMLILILMLCGCGSAPVETVPQNTLFVTHPPISLPSEETEGPIVLTLGNIKFTLPEGFILYSDHEDFCGFMSDDADCDISIYTFDVSSMTEEYVKDFLPDIHSKFISENEIRYNESDINYEIAGFSVIIDLYGDISDMDNTVVKMNTSFTDSWYSYTITYSCKTDGEKNKEYSNFFGEMLVSAEYTGNPPRFDYIQ